MPKPRTAADYEDDVTATSRSALAEVMTVLGAYREALVLIGGWAPFLILERFGEPQGFDPRGFQRNAFQTGFVHVGSIDIDLLVDPERVSAERYATIVELLTGRGYERVTGSRYQFSVRSLLHGPGGSTPIGIDFLTPRPLPGAGSSRRHRALQRDLQARTLEGAGGGPSHWFWYEVEILA